MKKLVTPLKGVSKQVTIYLNAQKVTIDVRSGV